MLHAIAENLARFLQDQLFREAEMARVAQTLKKRKGEDNKKRTTAAKNFKLFWMFA